jgi:hypothetical protein
VSSPAVPLPAPWTPTRRIPRRGAGFAAIPVAGGVLLGVGLASGSPALLVLGLVPLVLAALLRPEGAVLLFAAGMYLNLPVLASQQTGLPPAVTGAFALLLVVPFVGYVVIGRHPLVLTPALGLMMGYLLALVLSAAVAAGSAPSTVTPIVTFLTEGLLLYVLVTNAVRTTHTLRAVIWVLLLSGALMGLTSVWQEATRSYGQTLSGFAQIDETGFNVGDEITGKELRPRMAGPIGEKNRYAQVLLVLLPLAVSRIRAERSRTLKLLAGACAALILSGVMLTFSRGAAVAIGVLLVAMVVLRMVAIRHVVLLAAALVALVLAVAPDYVSRVQTLAAAESATSQSSDADQAVRGRVTEGLAAFYVFRDHPVIGVGPDQFFREYSTGYANELNLRFLETNRRSHNLYLEIAADTGLVGLTLFLAIVGTTMVQLWRVSAAWLRRRRRDLAQLAQGFLLALVAYLASGLFLQLSYQRYFWLLIALANSAIWILQRELRRADEAAAGAAVT